MYYRRRGLDRIMIALASQGDGHHHRVGRFVLSIQMNARHVAAEISPASGDQMKAVGCRGPMAPHGRGDVRWRAAALDLQR